MSGPGLVVHGHHGAVLLQRQGVTGVAATLLQLPYHLLVAGGIAATLSPKPRVMWPHQNRAAGLPRLRSCLCCCPFWFCHVCNVCCSSSARDFCSRFRSVAVLPPPAPRKAVQLAGLIWVQGLRFGWSVFLFSDGFMLFLYFIPCWYQWLSLVFGLLCFGRNLRGSHAFARRLALSLAAFTRVLPQNLALQTQTCRSCGRCSSLKRNFLRRLCLILLLWSAR